MRAIRHDDGTRPVIDRGQPYIGSGHELVLLATDHKKLARLAALRVIVDTLGRGVKLAEQEFTPEIAEMARKLWGWMPGKKNGTKK